MFSEFSFTYLDFCHTQMSQFIGRSLLLLRLRSSPVSSISVHVFEPLHTGTLGVQFEGISPFLAIIFILQLKSHSFRRRRPFTKAWEEGGKNNIFIIPQSQPKLMLWQCFFSSFLSLLLYAYIINTIHFSNLRSHQSVTAVINMQSCRSILTNLQTCICVRAAFHSD